MATNESNGGGTSTPVKMSFGMAKGLTKKPQAISKPSVFGASADDKPATQEDELIKGIQGNKVESLVKKEEKGPLVIPMEQNANWRAQVLAKRSVRQFPEESLVQPMRVTETLTTEVQYGLLIPKRQRLDSKSDLQGAETLAEADAIAREEDVVTETRTETLEEQAIRILELNALGRSTKESQPEMSLDHQENIRGDDLDAFQKNLDSLPDEATLEDYNNVPVEEFGAALLRGMGWKGDKSGSSPVLYQQRPALLGLGAKPKDPEPATKKYIKPGESRQSQSIRVPEHRSSSRSLPPSSSSRDTRAEEEGQRPSRASDRHYDRPRERERDQRDKDRERDRSRERYREQDHHRDRDRHRDSRSGRSDRDRDRDRNRDRDREYRDRERDRERDRDRQIRSREGDRYRERDRERYHDRDRSGRESTR